MENVFKNSRYCFYIFYLANKKANTTKVPVFRLYYYFPHDASWWKVIVGIEFAVK